MSEDGELWCFFRDMISRGTYIQMDYAAGKYKCYEEFSARLDEAARERVAHFKANRVLHRQSSQETRVGCRHCGSTPLATERPM